MLQFGLINFLENPIGKTEGQVVEEQRVLLRSAEELGFDSVWPVEHHFSEYGHCVSSAVILASLISVTRLIRLGSGVVVLPFHNPIRVAEEFALIDLLSGGRLEFGVGRGFQPHEFEGYGVDQSKSREIFREALEVILQAWTRESVDFDGAHFRIHDLQVRPKPLQKPHPPVWMAAVSQESFVYAGRMGFNVLCAPVFTVDGDTLKRNLDAYRGALCEAGHDPATKQIGALFMVYVARSAEQAARDFSEPAVWCYRAFSKYIAPPPGTPPVETYEPYGKIRDLAAAATWRQLQKSDALICGAPDDCIERIARLQERLGFTTLLCWTRVGGLDHQKVLASMALMQDYVIPHFRKNTESGGAGSLQRGAGT